MMAVMNLNYLVTGVAPGARRQRAPEHRARTRRSPCADGHVILAVGNDGQFAKFCEVAGRPRVGARSRASRRTPIACATAPMLVPMIAEVMRTRTQHDWLDALEAARRACGPINTLDQVFADPQVAARGMRFDLPHPLRRHACRRCGTPLRFSAHAAALRDGRRRCSASTRPRCCASGSASTPRSSPRSQRGA